MFFNTYETKWGAGAVVFSDKGLAGVLFPSKNEAHLEEEIYKKYGAISYDGSQGLELCSTLARYFTGKYAQLIYQVDYGKATEFEILVYENLKAIPYGKSITYAELASLCGRPRAARAVGNAMAKNPVPIVVPCHRVLRSDGGIGGWSGRPGWKETLLELEGML